MLENISLENIIFEKNCNKNVLKCSFLFKNTSWRMINFKLQIILNKSLYSAYF